MPELSLQVEISRDNLGLLPLDINDHTNYYVAGDFLTGQLSWNRNQVGSPFLDDQITVYRTLNRVTRALTVEVLGTSIATMNTNMITLVAAFMQDTFHLAVVADTDLNLEYNCEAADYQVGWTGPRLIQRQVSITFNVPCAPIPVVGGY